MSIGTKKDTLARKGRGRNQTKAQPKAVVLVAGAKNPTLDELSKVYRARMDDALAAGALIEKHPDFPAWRDRQATGRAEQKREEERAENARRRANERLVVRARNPLQFIEDWKGPETDVSETLHNVACAMEYLNGLQPSESAHTDDDELGRVLIQDVFVQAIKACRDEMRARHDAARKARAKAKDGAK